MPPQTLQQIRNTAVATDGFTNPVLVKQYTEAGGTLSGGRIPSRIALPGQETRAITVDDLMKPVGTTLVVPPPPTPASGGGTQAAAQAKIDSYQSTPPSEDIFSKFKEMVGETPSTEDAYLKAREEADFTAKQNEAIQAKARQRTAETEFRAIADSIKAASLEGEQKKQKLRAEIGEGIPTAILSRQELQVERQTAEKILPLQMQALVKQAEVASLQGNTEIAQDALQAAENNLNTLFRLKSQDAENTFNFKKELFFKALDIADKEQTRRLNAAEEKLDREREDEKEKRGAAEKWAIEALQTGDSSLAQEISELNPNSTTFYDDLARLQGRIEPKPEKPISLGDQFERFKEAFPTADITTPEGQRAWLDWRAREWEAGREETPKKNSISLSSERKNMLLEAGYLGSEIAQIERDVNELGLEAVLRAESDITLRKKLANSFDSKILFDRIEEEEKVELIKEMETVFSDSELFDISRKLGLTGYFSSKKTAKRNLFSKASNEQLRAELESEAKK